MIGTKEKRESRSLRVLEGLLMAGFQERKNTAQSAEADVLSVSAGGKNAPDCYSLSAGSIFPQLWFLIVNDAI